MNRLKRGKRYERVIIDEDGNHRVAYTISVENIVGNHALNRKYNLASLVQCRIVDSGNSLVPKGEMFFTTDRMHESSSVYWREKSKNNC